jgi:hypothetical protein
VTQHPMLKDEGRPEVATQPTINLAEAILIALEDGYRGIQVAGRSGDGKSTATKYLCSHPQWLKSPTPTCWVSIPRRSNGSDNVFYKVIQGALNLTNHPRAAAMDRLSHIVDRISSECEQMGARRFVLFIDEAQRLSADDYEFLANIDDGVNLDGFRLFCVLVNQSDDATADPKKGRCRIEDMPPHVVRRFFMADHIFRGLVGLSEIADALGRYDAMKHEGEPYTAYFASHAYEGGWRLASEAPKFVAAIDELRSDARLSGNSDLPMMIFELAVKRLLVHVAARKESFREFTKEDIKEAIKRAGYLKLESSRARQMRG